MILSDPKFTGTRKIKFSSTEKVILTAYVTALNLCKNDLKTLYRIFLDSMEVN